MAWTAPRTWVAGELVTATLMNTHLRDNISHVGGLKAGSDALSALTAATQVIPAGAVMPYAGATAPSGWLLCYGQAVSRTTYAGLFALIGTTYGSGDGSTTFNVPDLRGRAVIALDNLGGSSANVVTASAADSLGGTGGTETHTLTTAQLSSHGHDIRTRDSSLVSTPTGANTGFQRGTTNMYADAGTVTNYSGYPFIATSGSGSSHNNLQPYFALSYIIKT